MLLADAGQTGAAVAMCLEVVVTAHVEGTTDHVSVTWIVTCRVTRDLSLQGQRWFLVGQVVDASSKAQSLAVVILALPIPSGIRRNIQTNKCYLTIRHHAI